MSSDELKRAWVKALVNQRGFSSKYTEEIAAHLPSVFVFAPVAPTPSKATVNLLKPVAARSKATTARKTTKQYQDSGEANKGLVLAV